MLTGVMVTEIGNRPRPLVLPVQIRMITGGAAPRVPVVVIVGIGDGKISIASAAPKSSGYQILVINIATGEAIEVTKMTVTGGGTTMNVAITAARA